MGPRLDNRGWATEEMLARLFILASMGPRLDNRGWAARPYVNPVFALCASMGPRLDNRGWASLARSTVWRNSVLQWVHGWITVVGQKS